MTRVLYFCSKKLFTAVHNFIHINLAIALFIGYLVFAVGVELAKDDEVYLSCTCSQSPWHNVRLGGESMKVSISMKC